MYPSCIIINGRTISYVDLVQDELPRLSQKEYELFIEKQLAKEERDVTRRSQPLAQEAMLLNGYLPILAYKLCFDPWADVQWFSREELVFLFKEQFFPFFLLLEKDKYCYQKYGKKYREIKKETFCLQQKISRRIAYVEKQKKIKEIKALDKKRRQEEEARLEGRCHRCQGAGNIFSPLMNSSGFCPTHLEVCPRCRGTGREPGM